MTASVSRRSTVSWQMVRSATVAVVLTMFATDITLLSASPYVSTTSFAQVWPGVMFGFLGSQLMVAVLYAALGDGSGLTRIVYTAGVLTVFSYTLALFGVWWFAFDWSDIVVLFLFPPMLFFLLQIPVWAVRSCFGWTIRSPWSKPERQTRMRFSLVHMLGWSLFLAVPLCILSTFNWNNAIAVQGLVICCLWGLVGSAMTMSFVYLALVVVGAWKFVLAAMISLLLGVMLQLAAIWLWDEMSWWVLLVSTNVTAGATILFCLRLAYSLKFRLLPFHVEAVNVARPKE